VTAPNTAPVPARTPIFTALSQRSRHTKPFAEIPHLTKVWAYGRVFNTSSGFHGEYLTLDENILSLLCLGPDEDQALQLIKKITQQHLFIIELVNLY